MSANGEADSCAECGSLINGENLSHSGGGGVNGAGEWYEYRIGACCRPPLTREKVEAFMAEVFKATK